jgi:hypothetical protein
MFVYGDRQSGKSVASKKGGVFKHHLQSAGSNSLFCLGVAYPHAAHRCTRSRLDASDLHGAHVDQQRGELHEVGYAAVVSAIEQQTKHMHSLCTTAPSHYTTRCRWPSDSETADILQPGVAAPSSMEEA